MTPDNNVAPTGNANDRFCKVYKFVRPSPGCWQVSRLGLGRCSKFFSSKTCKLCKRLITGEVVKWTILH